MHHFIKGTAVTTSLRELAALRAAEFSAYREAPPPDDHFETYGMAYHRNSFKNPESIPMDDVGEGCTIGAASVVAKPALAGV